MNTYYLKLSFIIASLALLFSCNQDELNNTVSSDASSHALTDHFYGTAYPDVTGVTRGIAQRENLWYPCSTIKVKFLNDPYHMADKVKTYAAEWEKYAGIHFNFVESGDAHVRIGFDWNNERYITWSYIGTDCKMVTNQQEATMSFAYWDSSTEQEIKGDVLRAFGQVLGLELEHRHLDFEAGWTARIADYWEGEIGDIPWESLQKYVFTPLERNGSILQTAEYDENSIMIWPFSSRYARSTARSFNYELSEKDKEFVGKLYPKCEEESIGDTLVAEETELSYHFDYYVDAPGNLYGVYGKGNFDLYSINNMYSGFIDGIYSYNIYLNWPYNKHTFGLCNNLIYNEMYYCITGHNQLLALPHGNNPTDISDKFPSNTVFLALTSSHDSAEVFVSTATSDGSDNHRKSYNSQKIYRIGTNDGSITEVVGNLNIPPVFHSDYIRSLIGSSGNLYSEMLFPYTSVISKSKGSYVYGLGGDGRYYKANVATGSVAYYTPRVPVQFLAGGTNSVNSVALSGRQILELRPDQSTDRVIGYLPDTIGEPLLFLSNADQTIFYVFTYEQYVYSYDNSLYYAPRIYRLRVNN